MSPLNITIAITVYNRREFIFEAVESALRQSVPVKVIVVEDCGPDPNLKELVTERFGSEIVYHRNVNRQGLFGNWNACLEICRTRWISILHDDDVLEPGFVEAMMELADAVPDMALYCGRDRFMNEKGEVEKINVQPDLNRPWRQFKAIDAVLTNPVFFPGNLFLRECVLDLGGFRTCSQYCGDWEIWFKLISQFGAAQTNTLVARVRNHSSGDRGTSRVDRNGKRLALEVVQRRRNLAFLRALHVDPGIPPDKIRAPAPISIRYLVEHFSTMGDRLLHYNVQLFLESPPANWSHYMLKWMFKFSGSRMLRFCSILYRRLILRLKS